MSLPLASQRVTVISMLVASILLIFYSALFLFHEFSAFRRMKSSELTALAAYVGIDAQAAISFGDSRGAQESLESLARAQSVLAALIILPDGTEFAGYVTSDKIRGWVKDGVAKIDPVTKLYSDDKNLYTRSPIMLNGEHLGDVVLVGRLRQDSFDIRGTFFLLGSALAVGLLFSFMLARLFDRVVSSPVQKLSTTMSSIAETKNYSLRAEVDSYSEIDTLVEVFNHMLNELQLRDSELQRNKNELEQKVNDRTRDLAQMLQNVEEAKKVAEESNRAKSDFLAKMSHEIRTPLSGIIGLVDLLRYSELTDQQKMDLEALRSCSEQLKQLVEDILQVARIEANKLAVRQDEFDMSLLINRLMTLYQRNSLREERVLRVTWLSEPLSPVVGDSVKVGQILSNLLSNAFKFTPYNGVIELLVEIERTGAFEVQFTFQVKDNGIGIPEDKQEIIFERFSQIDDSLTRLYGGTGLGLAICRELTNLMGGSITVESRPGEGSTFSVILPFTLPAAVQEDLSEKELPINHAVSGLSESTEHSVLLVEDSPTNQMVISRLLMASGYAVDIAADGNEAFLYLKKRNYYAMLLDIHMPQLSGYEVARLIRSSQSSFAQIPIVALSADVVPGVQDKCFDSGMNFYLSKPVYIEDLLDVLDKVRELSLVPS